jgi:hypothetical protein
MGSVMAGVRLVILLLMFLSKILGKLLRTHLIKKAIMDYVKTFEQSTSSIWVQIYK